MSNLQGQTLEEQIPPATNQNPNDNNSFNNNQQQEVQVQRDQSQEWETMARAWLSAFPEAKAVSSSQVDAWIDSNYSSLPADLQSMPRSELIDRLLSIQNYMKLPNQVSYSLPLTLFTHYFSNFLNLYLYRRRKKGLRLKRRRDSNGLISGYRFMVGWKIWIKMKSSNPKIFPIG